MAKETKKQPKIPEFTEGVDFNIENGLYVFTEKYLRERGFCCENGCRHCPYNFKKEKTA